MIKINKKFFVLVVCVTILFSILSAYYFFKTVQEDKSISFVDFRVYYYAGFGLEEGLDIYNSKESYFIYKYSPIFALVMSLIKFCTVEPCDALIAWYLILYISFILSLYLIKEILFKQGPIEKLNLFDFVPLLFIFRYLILINFIHTYMPRDWPLIVKIFDIILLYGIGPLYMFSLLFTYVPVPQSEAVRNFVPRNLAARLINTVKAWGNTHKNNLNWQYLIIMIISVLFVLRFLALNIDRAQINIVILLFILFFTYYFVKKRDILAGIYLGIAIVFKLTPTLFLIYLLFKRRVKCFISSVSAFTLLLIIPSFRWGIKRNVDLLIGWTGVLKRTLPVEYLQHKNQSLMAMICRFFSKNSNISIIKLNEVRLTGLTLLIYGLCIFLLIYLIIRKSKISEKKQVIYDISLFFIAMTVLSPVGTKATFIYTLFPAVVLIKETFDRQLKDRRLNLGLVIYVLLIYLNSSDIIGDFSITLHQYSLMTISLIILFCLTVYGKFNIRY